MAKKEFLLEENLCFFKYRGSLIMARNYFIKLSLFIK